MAGIEIDAPGETVIFMGNEAIARGALEAGIGFAASYPGTPASEIMDSLAPIAQKMGFYAEWSVNEMVAMEAAAVLTKVFPMRMVANSLSTLLSSWLTPLALREPFCARWSSRYGLEAIKAVSAEEKKALRRRNKNSIRSAGSCIFYRSGFNTWRDILKAMGECV